MKFSMPLAFSNDYSSVLPMWKVSSGFVSIHVLLFHKLAHSFSVYPC